MKPLIALVLFIGAIASAQTPVVTSTSGTPIVNSGTPIINGAPGTPVASGGTPVIGGSTPVVASGGYIQWSTPPAFQTMTAGTNYWIGTPGAFTATVPLMANSAISTGILEGLFTMTSAAPAAGNTVTVTVYDGATPTALTCTLGSGVTRCSDFTHHQTPVTLGDKIYVVYQCAGTCGTNSMGTTIAIVGIEPATAQQLPAADTPEGKRRDAAKKGNF
jgi:hypothetical protein